MWGMFMTAPKAFQQNAARVGFALGIDQGDRIFQALMDNPQGIWVGKADENNPMAGIKTPSGKIELVIPEIQEEAGLLDAESEAKDL